MAAVLAKRISNNALYVCLAAMDSCWIYLVAWLTSAYILSRLADLPVPSPVLLALIELASLWLGLKLAGSRLSNGLVQTISGIAGLAVTAFVMVLVSPASGDGFSVRWLGVSSFGAIVCLLMWYLGAYRAGRTAEFNEAYSMFRIGLGAIGLSAVLTALFAHAQSAQAWAGLGGVSLWFFAWSMLALALGNRELVREEAGSTATGPWSAVLVVSLIAILVVGAGSGAFGAGGILDIGQKIVLGIALAIGAVIYAGFWVVLSIASLFNSETKPGAPKPPDPEDAYRILGRFGSKNPEEGLAAFKGLGISPEWINLFIWAGVVALVLLVVWLLGKSLRQARKIRMGDALEEREKLGSWDMFFKQLRAWLEARFGRKGGTQSASKAVSKDDWADLQGRAEWSGTLSVRQIYSHLQRAASQIGLPRNPQQTPLEYLVVLERALPEHKQDFAAITAAYIEARYGAVPASGPAVLRAQEAWRRTEPALQSRASAASTGAAAYTRR